MRKILVLGSSIAGVRAIEEIRQADLDSEATILADAHYPYDRSLFLPVITKEVEYKKIFYKPSDFYEKNRIQVLLDRKISRINLKKNRITTEDKQQFDYEVLIIADAPGYKLPDIKGVHKNGVYPFRQLKEIDQILDVLPLMDTVVIQSDSARGLSIAAAFLKKDKEVICIISTEQIAQEWLAAHAGQKIVIYQNPITEILGEGDVKAVRLSSGKVLAAQMVIFPEAKGDFKLFADSPLKINNKICVNEQFQAGVEGVFAVDAACEYPAAGSSNADSLPVAVLEQQGATVAAALKDPRTADVVNS